MLWGKTYRQDKNRREPLPDAYFKSNGVVNGGRIMTRGGRHNRRPPLCHIPIFGVAGMTDRYPYTIEDKGTIRQFKARRIIITCPRCPGEYKWETMKT